MHKALGYSETLKEMGKSSFKKKMREADFLCDQCCAPMKIDWEAYRVAFGDYIDEDLKMICGYCGGEYKVNPHNFFVYYQNKMS